MFIRDEFGEVGFVPSSLCCIAGGSPAGGAAGGFGGSGPSDGPRGGGRGGRGGDRGGGGDDNGRGGSERRRPVEPKIKAKRVKKTRNQDELLSDKDTQALPPKEEGFFSRVQFALKRRQGSGQTILAGRGLGDSVAGPAIARPTLG